MWVMLQIMRFGVRQYFMYQNVKIQVFRLEVCISLVWIGMRGHLAVFYDDIRSSSYYR